MNEYLFFIKFSISNGKSPIPNVFRNSPDAVFNMCGTLPKFLREKCLSNIFAFIMETELSVSHRAS